MKKILVAEKFLKNLKYYTEYLLMFLKFFSNWIY